MRKALFILGVLVLVAALILLESCAFPIPSLTKRNCKHERFEKREVRLYLSSENPAIEDATRILQEWDRLYNPNNADVPSTSMEDLLPNLQSAVLLLNQRAAEERTADSTLGRCMLGICASSASDGIQALKSWVSALELPRGLLHGMDKDGLPLEIEGPVYIKYNSGGVYNFADIRKSGLGFDALWKPGDALLEPYNEGDYRGVYFQVELADGEFRQYLVPLDLFEL